MFGFGVAGVCAGTVAAPSAPVLATVAAPLACSVFQESTACRAAALSRRWRSTAHSAESLSGLAMAGDFAEEPARPPPPEAADGPLAVYQSWLAAGTLREVRWRGGWL